MTRRLVAAVVLCALVATGACRRDAGSGTESAQPSTTATTAGGSPGSGAAPPDEAATIERPHEPAVDVPAVERPRGGSARVAVWADPDPEAPTVGGAAVRALVHPQLFVARPDGRWSSALAEPGTDRTADDRRSASFRLRPGATWSDGQPITVDDLRRTADARFVTGVDDPAPDGTVTVRFTGELPGWRRLWSAQDTISPPRPDVWGGPFVVAERVPGLETVLRRNERWWGPRQAHLDEVRLVLVPDPTTVRLLLARGELDVVMPLAATVRTPQLDDIAGVDLSRSTLGGWRVSLRTNPERLDMAKRKAVLAAFDRAPFGQTLLQGEARVLDGFTPAPEGAWAGVGAGDTSALKGQAVDLVGFVEEPMTALVHRSMQKRARQSDGTLELRTAEAGRVEGWLREGSYEAAIVLDLDPLGRCWVCRWAGVAGVEAADAGDEDAVRSLEATLRDEGLVLPLWQGETVVATRSPLSGTSANGYAASGAWNAWEWWRPAG